MSSCYICDGNTCFRHIEDKDMLVGNFSENVDCKKCGLYVIKLKTLKLIKINQNLKKTMKKQLQGRSDEEKLNRRFSL
jgi:hypothetical protein